MRSVHFFILLVILVLVCVLGYVEYFQECIPVTPYTHEIAKEKGLSRGITPMCQVADPLGADDKSKKLTPVHCKVSDWKSEGSCAAACKQYGKQVWKRKIITQPANGGTPCPKELIEQRICVGECKAATGPPSAAIGVSSTATGASSTATDTTTCSLCIKTSRRAMLPYVAFNSLVTMYPDTGTAANDQQNYLSTYTYEINRIKGLNVGSQVKLFKYQDTQSTTFGYINLNYDCKESTTAAATQYINLHNTSVTQAYTNKQPVVWYVGQETTTKSNIDPPILPDFIYRVQFKFVITGEKGLHTSEDVCDILTLTVNDAELIAHARKHLENLRAAYTHALYTVQCTHSRVV